MKILLFGLFSLVALHCSAQEDYTTFIQCRKISWAANTSDTLRFSSQNLNLLFRQNLIDNKIKVSLSDENFQLKKRNNADADAIRNRIAPNRILQTANEQGKITGSVKESLDPLFSEKYFDSLTANLLETQEIIFIKNGKPLTYIPFVSAKYNVYTSWGEKLGIANAFNTAFNNCYKLRRSLSRKAMMIGQTQKHYVLKSLEAKMLKQLYEQNFVEALWPHLNNKYYHFYDLTRSSPIKLKNIDKSLIDNREMTVQVYDSTGQLNAQKVPFLPLSHADIQEVRISEEWFYNEKKQKVFSKIKTITLYAKVWRNGIQQETASPILNIAVD